jgi:hypothetical protein
MHSLRIFSSDPSLLIVSNPDIKVQGPCNTKISLIFNQYPNTEQTQYILFVIKDDEPWQKITLITKYVE